MVARAPRATSSGSRSARPTPSDGVQGSLGRARRRAVRRHATRRRTTAPSRCSAPTCHGDRRRRRHAHASWSRASDPRCDLKQKVDAKLAEEQPYCLPAQVAWAAPNLQLAPLRYSRAQLTQIITYGRPGTPMPAWGVLSGKGALQRAEHPGPRELPLEHRHHARQGAGAATAEVESCGTTTRSRPRRGAGRSSRAVGEPTPTRQGLADAQAELAAAQASLAEATGDASPRHQLVRRSRRPSGCPALAGDHAVGERRPAPVHEQLRSLPHAGLVLLRPHQPARPEADPIPAPDGRRRLRAQPHRWRRRTTSSRRRAVSRSCSAGSASACPTTSSTASAASRRAACRTSAPSSPRTQIEAIMDYERIL